MRHVVEVAVFGASGLGLLLGPGYVLGWLQFALAVLYWLVVRPAMRVQPGSVARIYRRNTIVLFAACLLSLLGLETPVGILLLAIALVIAVRSRTHGHPNPDRNDVSVLLKSF